MHGQPRCGACVRCLYIGMYFSSRCDAVAAVRVFILKTHVQHYELKSQMFIIIIGTRESDQISVFLSLALALTLTHLHVFRPFFFHFTFHLPHPLVPFTFTSNWWCDIYKMILIFDLIGWLFELLQMDIKSNKFVYCFCCFFILFWRFDQRNKISEIFSLFTWQNEKRAISVPLSNFTPILCVVLTQQDMLIRIK